MIDRILSLIRSAMGGVLLVCVALNATNAALRIFWGSNIVWAEEMLTYGMIFIIMIGTILVTSTDQHLRMDALVSKVNPAVQSLLRLTAHLTLTIVFGYLTLQSWTVVSLMLRTGQSSVAAGIPMWVPHGVLLIAFSLCAIASLLMALHILINKFGPTVRLPRSNEQ